MDRPYGQARTSVGSPSPSSFIQSGVKPTVSGWEACPQLGLRGHWRACSPFEWSIFTHGVAILERNRRARECLTAGHAHHGETSLHLPPLTWASELGFVHGSPRGFAMGLTRGPQVGCWESRSACQCLCVFTCVSGCWIWGLCVLARASGKTQPSPWKTVSHLWSFLHGSQNLCGSSLILHIWSLGCSPRVFSLGIPHWKRHY